MIISTTDIQNNFGKYLKLSEKEDVVITKNGKAAARLSAYKSDDQGGFIVNESRALYNYDRQKVTYEEFLKISGESDERYEYIDGEIYLIASPFFDHQKAVRNILFEFTLWFRDKACEPIGAPYDVTLVKGEENINVVQPDILVICDIDNIDAKGKYSGTPSLVAEVLSDATRSKDFIKKLDLYMQSGVKEYWIVNTDTKEIYIYVFHNGNITNNFTYKDSERVESPTFKGLSMEMGQIFA